MRSIVVNGYTETEQLPVLYRKCIVIAVTTASGASALAVTGSVVMHVRAIISVPKLDLTLSTQHSNHHLSEQPPPNPVASSNTERYARPGRRLVKKGVPHTAREKPVAQQYPQYSSVDDGIDVVDIGRLIKNKLRNDDMKLLRRIHKQFVTVESKPRSTITHISKDAKQRGGDNDNNNNNNEDSTQLPLFIARRIPLRTNRLGGRSISSRKKNNVQEGGDFMSVSIDRITTSDLYARGLSSDKIDLSQNVLAGASAVELYADFNSMDWFENRALEGYEEEEGAGGVFSGGGSSVYDIDDIVNSSTYQSMSTDDFLGRYHDGHRAVTLSGPSVVDDEGGDALVPLCAMPSPQPPAALNIEEIAHKTALVFQSPTHKKSTSGMQSHAAAGEGIGNSDAFSVQAQSKYTLRTRNDDMLLLNSLIYGSTAHVNVDDISDAAQATSNAAANPLLLSKSAASGKGALVNSSDEVGFFLRSQRLVPSKETVPQATVPSADTITANATQEDDQSSSTVPEKVVAYALVPSQQPKKKAISFAVGVGNTSTKADAASSINPQGPSYIMSPAITGPPPDEGSEDYPAYLRQEARRKQRSEIIAGCREALTKREMAEIMVHKAEIYFLGDKAFKQAFDKRQKNNGYDDGNGYYIASPYDHLYFRYEIVVRLHRGTHSALHKVNDRKSKRVYAVKVYRGGAVYSALAVNEDKILRILKADKAKGAVRIINSFEFRGHFCIVMPLYSGPSLRTHLESSSFEGLSAKKCRVVVDQLSSCLVHLKRSKIVHCGIRPSSILVKHFDPLEVCLFDFSHSRLYSNNSEEGGEAPLWDGSALHYLSPEVLLGGRLGFEADVWSLGCTIFELATGCVLFSSPSERGMGSGSSSADHTSKSADHISKSDSTAEEDYAQQVACIRCLGDTGAPSGAPATRHLRDYMHLITGRETEQQALLGVLRRTLRWDVGERVQADELGAKGLDSGAVDFVV